MPGHLDSCLSTVEVFRFFTTSRAVSGPPAYQMGNGAFHQGPNSWAVTLITDRYLV